MNTDTKKVVINSIVEGTKVELSLDNLYTSLANMGEYVQLSKNNKVMPIGEQKVSIPVTLNDGKVTTVELSITAWMNRDHAKGAKNALIAEQKRIEQEQKLEAAAQKFGVSKEVAASILAEMAK